MATVIKNTIGQMNSGTIQNKGGFGVATFPKNLTKNVATTIAQAAAQKVTEQIAEKIDKVELGAEKTFLNLKYAIPYWVSRIVQGVFWPIFYVGFHSFFKLRIRGQEKLQGIKGPVIFVSNHFSIYDSFIFDLFVAPFSRIPPFRFMGTLKFQLPLMRVLKYTGIVHLVYMLFGVFKVESGQGVDAALTEAYKIINNGGTVCIFPEGKVWLHKREGEPIGPFKWGAAFLAKNTGAVVVPVAFRKEGMTDTASRTEFNSDLNDKSASNGRGGFSRKKLEVVIGDPYFVNKAHAPEVITSDMRERVVGLFDGVYLN
jgi:1-acyl-sn-glycerol-3-phosphate acyltransferase